MNRSEFVALAIANSDKTSNVRITRNWESSGVVQVADRVAKEFGRVIALLQAQIKKDKLCKKDEFLLIYNFQPIQTVEGIDYYSLDMLIKPIKEIEEIEAKGGVPLQLVVNGATGEVMNNSKGMLDMGICSYEELLQDEEEAPASLGNYNHYLALYDIKHETIQLEYNNEVLLAQEFFDMKSAVKVQTFVQELAQVEQNINKPMLNLYCPKLTVFVKNDEKPHVKQRTIQKSKSHEGTFFMFKTMSAKPYSSVGAEQTLDLRDNKDFPSNFHCKPESLVLS